MGMLTYRATGAGITAMLKLTGTRVRITGGENIDHRPTLFVVNHFTRLETLLIPYAVYKAVQSPVRTLATHTIFTRVLAGYLKSCNVISTRDPARNRTIIHDLITGEFDWVIYPEGGLIKDKKTIRRGRLHLNHPGRSGPPHTGAALLAIKAEMSKRRYRKAIREQDERRMQFYEQRYGLTGPEDLCDDGVVIVPVTITYHSLRPREGALYRMLQRLKHDMKPKYREELEIESSILRQGSEISIHFSPPIGVKEFLFQAGKLVRRIVGKFSEERRNELMLRRPARRLTSTAMRSVYQNLEINFDHLFCFGLATLKRKEIAARDFHKALYIASMELRTKEELRLHPTLRNGISALATGEAFAPLSSIEELACAEGALEIRDKWYAINRHTLAGRFGFHDIRLKNMVRVIANELEPVKTAAEIVRRAVNLSSSQLRERISETISAHDRTVFRREYNASPNNEDARPVEFGEPFFMHHKRSKQGVLLIHGYLASPEQLRPMANELHKAGLNVYGVRLAGHGTSPDQLCDVSWLSWMESTTHGFTVLRQHCDHIAVGGFSLGGVLALLLAARGHDKLSSVFTINAPLRLRDPRFPLIGIVAQTHAMMRAFGLVKHPMSRSNHRTESPDINYTMDYISGVREVRRAMMACRRSLESVYCPALILQADNDPVVASQSGRMIHDRISSDIKQLEPLHDDRHVIVRGESAETLYDRISHFIRYPRSAELLKAS